MNNDNLGGTIPSGQTVDIIGNPTYNSNTTLGANLTNDGTLEIDTLSTAGSGAAYLSGPSHTVTNAGTFETEGGRSPRTTYGPTSPIIPAPPSPSTGSPRGRQRWRHDPDQQGHFLGG